MPEKAAPGDPVVVNGRPDSGKTMARMVEPAYVHLDTSVLMQFRRPDEIPWPDLVGAEVVVLMLCPQVVTELDHHKTSNDPRKQKRAKALIKWLRERHKDPGVRNGVVLEFIVVEPTDFQGHQLDASVGDDRIVASVLEHKAKNPEAAVRLCTADFGITLKAGHRGISVLEISEDYELPPAEDSKEKELTRLKSQLREPKLSLESKHGSDRVEIELPAVVMWSAEQIDAEVEAERAVALGDDESKKYRADLSEVRIVSGGRELDDDPVLELEGLVESYLGRLRGHLNQASERASEQVRALKIVLRLRNSGTAPATKIDVRFRMPEWVSLKREIELDEPSERPTWNLKEEMFRPLHEKLFPRFLDFPRVQIEIPQLEGFFEEDSSWFSRRLQHGSTETVEFYVVIDSDHDVQGFQLEYEIHADECGTPVKGKIHVVPKTFDTGLPTNTTSVEPERTS